MQFDDNIRVEVVADHIRDYRYIPTTALLCYCFFSFAAACNSFLLAFSQYGTDPLQTKFNSFSVSSSDTVSKTYGGNDVSTLLNEFGCGGGVDVGGQYGSRNGDDGVGCCDDRHADAPGEKGHGEAGSVRHRTMKLEQSSKNTSISFNGTAQSCVHFVPVYIGTSNMLSLSNVDVGRQTTCSDVIWTQVVTPINQSNFAVTDASKNAFGTLHLQNKKTHT